MKRILLPFLVLMLVLTSMLGLSSCGKDVEFNVNFVVDGEIYATVGTSGEETIRIPENPTKDGYAFDGWYWDNGVWQKPFTANSLLDAPLSSDMSVYAKWACVHSSSEWIVDLESTCKESGSKHKECTKCEEILETKVIDKLTTHTPAEAVTENFVDSTCKVEGSYDEVVYCSICGIEISRTEKTVAKKTTHTPGEVKTENFVDSTCKVEGSYDEVVYCSVCDIEISRTEKTIEKKTTHTPDEAVTENFVDSTCKVEGSYDEVVYCSVCDVEISRTEKTVAKKTTHTPDEAVNENFVDSTCKAEGSYDEVVYCSVCDVEISRTEKTVAKKTTHTHAEAVTENFVDSTCKVEGSYDEVVYCSICDVEIIRTEKIVAKKTTHTPGEAKTENFVDSTCKVEGSYDEVVYCSICDVEIIRTEKIVAKKTTHTPGEAKTENFVDSTCKVEGSYDEVVYCSVCGVEISRTEKTVEKKTTHTPDEAVTENFVDSTCKVEGSYDEVVYCSVCGKMLSTEIKTVEKKEHTEVVDKAVAPTCTETGLAAGKHCSVCNEVLVAQTVIPANDHSYDEWEIIKQPTESASGEKRRDCANCDAFETDVVAPLSHDHSRWDVIILDAVAPDCVNTGLTEGKKCSGCGETLVAQQTVAALGHLHNSVVTAPTCTEKGFTTHTCHCGDTYIDSYVDELGHKYNDGIITTAPTCTDKGVKTFTCATCGDYYTEAVAALGHTEGEIVVENNVDPDCVNDGSYDNVVYCTVCDAELSRNTVTVDALGHKDENADGYCDTCDTIVDLKLAISGTYYSIYREKIILDTTYFKLDEEGVTVLFIYEISDGVFTASYHSVICDDAELKELFEEYYEDAVFAYGFSFDKETITFTDDDISNIYYRPEFLPPCEHDVVTIEGQAPTCTEEGYTDFVYCDICGEVFTELEVIEKIDHNYDQMVASDDYLKSEATVDSPASYYKSCICGAKGEETFTYGDVLTIPLSSVTLNKTEITLAVGATETLIATLNPSNTTEKIKWVSSDDSVVKVVNGTLIAVGRGNAIVTVETEDYIFAYCTVKVIIPVENVTLDKSEAEIYVGQPFALNAIVLPENADGKTLTWTSSNESVATVNANGVVTAKSAGTTVITATAPNGVSASCVLTVKAGEIKFATDEFGFHYVIGYEGYETDIEIPSMHDGGRVTRIAENAFKNNTLIKSITLPNTIEVIDAYAFYGCTALEAIVIPTSITVINDYTFAECSSLVSVTLNKSTTAIGAYAFANCTSLKNVIFPAKDAKLSAIGSYAFTNCTVLEAIDFSGVAEKLETIGDHAFYYCTALKSVSLADSVKTISESSFERCSALTEIDLGESLVTIANKAFEYCTSLKKIEMPNTVTTLGNYAFRHNDSLTEIVFSDNLAKIGIAAFQSCISIETLILPENIKELGNSAFSYCEGIETLIILGDITNWGDSTFYECTSVEYIYIASRTNSTVRENNYIFYNVGADTEEGLALILGVNAVIPENLFSPVEDEENYPRIAGIAAEDGATTVNAFKENNRLPYLVIVSLPDSIEEITYGIFNNSPWWEAQEKGVVYIDNYFYGYKCECHAATPTEIWVENYLAPTCTEEGFYQNVCKCSVCEYEVLRQDVIIPELGHAPRSAIVENYVAPDCITDGSYDSVIYCGRCEDELERENIIIDALDHDYIDHEAQEVTCLEIGWDAYQTCGRCDYTTYEEIPALGHSPLDAVIENNVDPDCLNDGYYETVVYCDRCDAELSRVGTVVDALGHDYIDHDAQAVTCLEIGWDAYQTCGRCDYTTYEEISALGHDYIDHEAREVTCTEIGWDSYQTCSRCDYNKYEEIPALGHDYIDHDARAATCTEIGWDAYQTCGRCDYTTYVEIPLGHDYIDHGAQTVTCLEIGWNAYQTCSRCDYTTYDEIAPLGHDYIHHEAKSPNCGDIGWNEYDTCSRCSYTTYVELPITGYLHSTSNGACTICGLPESTPGLEYTLNSNGKTYTVTGIGTCSASDIVIGIYNDRNVTSIGVKAFRDCTNLRSVTIGDSVTSIGNYAFYGCTSLTSVTIGDRVTSIGNSAFYGCTALEEIYFNATAINDLSSYNYVFSYAGQNGEGIKVVIGKNVTKIPAYLFYPYYYSSYSPKITSVEFENGSVCTSIGSSAFYNCTSLTSITIPDSVTTIGSDAFGGCSRLTSITVDENNAYYKDIDGNLYSKDGKTLIQYAIGKTDTSFTIPNGVTSIGEEAFYDCTSLTSVTIPDSVTSIDEAAFYNCTSLTCVTIGNNVASIGDFAFWGCSSLTSVTIPDSVETIRQLAFAGCSNLSELTLGNSLSGIGYDAFLGCTSLTSITVDENNAYCKDIDGNLYSKNGKTLIQYAIGKIDTSFTIPNSVTSICYGAFADCTSLTSVTIPDSVTSIDYMAFSSCTSLTIYCEAASKPSGWDSDWNYSNRPVVWGYTGEEYSYNFVTNGGEEIESVTADRAFTLPTPTREGYRFMGWYDNAELSGNPVSSPYSSKTAHTLYAKWMTEEEYLASLDGSSFEKAYIITSGESLPAVIDTAGEYVYFKFTATGSKTYTFQSSGSYDTYGYLYNSSQSQLSTNDDSGDGSNFKITRSMSAGETVYLKVKLYSSSSTGTFTVTVS